jgi:hypothetical protein
VIRLLTVLLTSVNAVFESVFDSLKPLTHGPPKRPCYQSQPRKGLITQQPLDGYNNVHSLALLQSTGHVGYLKRLTASQKSQRRPAQFLYHPLETQPGIKRTKHRLSITSSKSNHANCEEWSQTHTNQAQWYKCAYIQRSFHRQIARNDMNMAKVLASL